jgi:hydrogenase 3 maturation protease
MVYWRSSVANRDYDVKKELKKWLLNVERVVIAGVGNPIRRDDFVGVRIVQVLRGKVSPKKVYLIECETVPESFVQQIADFNPTHVLLIDAAVLGLKPGEARLAMPEQLIAYPAFSTHMLPLRIFCEYISKTTNAKIALLLIEPKQTDFGERMSREIEATTQNIVDVLLGILP